MTKKSSWFKKSSTPHFQSKFINFFIKIQFHKFYHNSNRFTSQKHKKLICLSRNLLIFQKSCFRLVQEAKFAIQSKSFHKQRKIVFPKLIKLWVFRNKEILEKLSRKLFLLRKNKKIQENSNLNILSIERKSGKL